VINIKIAMSMIFHIFFKMSMFFLFFPILVSQIQKL